jgi:hypothetical protein
MLPGCAFLIASSVFRSNQCSLERGKEAASLSSIAKLKLSDKYFAARVASTLSNP